MKVKATLSLTGATCLVDTISLSYWKRSCWWGRRRKVLARYSFPRNSWIYRPGPDTLNNTYANCVNLPLKKLIKKDGETVVEVCCKAGNEDLLVSHVSLDELLTMLARTKRGDEALLIFGMSGVVQKSGSRYTAIFCNGERCGGKSAVPQDIVLPKNLPRKTVQAGEDEGVNTHQDNNENKNDSQQTSNPSMEKERESLTQNAGDDDGVASSKNMVHTNDNLYHNEKDLDHAQKKNHTLYKDNNYVGHIYKEDNHQDHKDEDFNYEDDDHKQEKRVHRREDNVDLAHGEEYRYYMNHIGEEDFNVDHSNHGNDLFMDHINKERFYTVHGHEEEDFIDHLGRHSSCMEGESDDEDHSHGYKVHAGHSYEDTEYIDHRPQYTDHTCKNSNHAFINIGNTNGSRTYTDKKDHYNINYNINTNMARRYDHNVYLHEGKGYLKDVDKYCHHTPEERAYFSPSGTYWNYEKGDKTYTDYNDRGNTSYINRQGYIRRRRNHDTQIWLPSYNYQTSAIKNKNTPRRLCPQRPTSIHTSSYAPVLRVGLVVLLLLLYWCVLEKLVVWYL